MRKKRRRRKYPFAFPSLGGDVFFPRSNIPRPVYMDIRLHPKFFGIKKRQPHKLRRRRHARF